jgi:hypothetical protein
MKAAKVGALSGVVFINACSTWFASDIDYMPNRQVLQSTKPEEAAEILARVAAKSGGGSVGFKRWAYQVTTKGYTCQQETAAFGGTNTISIRFANIQHTQMDRVPNVGGTPVLYRVHLMDNQGSTADTLVWRVTPVHTEEHCKEHAETAIDAITVLMHHAGR